MLELFLLYSVRHLLSTLLRFHSTVLGAKGKQHNSRGQWKKKPIIPMYYTLFKIHHRTPWLPKASIRIRFKSYYSFLSYFMDFSPFPRHPCRGSSAFLSFFMNMDVYVVYSHIRMGYNAKHNSKL